MPDKYCAKRISLSLEELRSEAELAPDSPPIHKYDYEHSMDLIVVERSPSGDVTIVDGYHRAGGLLNWALSEDKALHSVRVAVVDATACDVALIEAAAVPDGTDAYAQEEALEKIYQSVRK